MVSRNTNTSSESPDGLNLLDGLTDKQLDLRPYCIDCGWRKGGLDSWNGSACKCGHHAPTFRELFTWRAA